MILNQILKCYPTLDLEFVPIEIGLSWKENQEKYLEIIEDGLSKEARVLIREGSGFNNPNIVSQRTQIYLKTQEGHPEYNYLSLGIFGVIKEIEYAKSLNLKYYYLGYYIENNQKMSYKNKFIPHNFFDWKKNKWINPNDS